MFKEKMLSKVQNCIIKTRYSDASSNLTKIKVANVLHIIYLSITHSTKVDYPVYMFQDKLQLENNL